MKGTQKGEIIGKNVSWSRKRPRGRSRRRWEDNIKIDSKEII
jgi:ribosomal protein L28